MKTYNINAVSECKGRFHVPCEILYAFLAKSFWRQRTFYFYDMMKWGGGGIGVQGFT